MAKLVNMTQNPPDAQSSASHVIYHNDLGALPVGELLSQAAVALQAEIPGGFHIPGHHPSWTTQGCFKVVERGLGKYIESVGGSLYDENRILVTGHASWADYQFRAVVTPLSFDDASPSGGICGIIARYVDSRNYLALVLDRDGQVKLLQRRNNVFELLDASPLEFCLGQSLTLTLTVSGLHAIGTAGPYSGVTRLEATIGSFTPASDQKEKPAGKIGFIADVPARLGPLSVECSAEEFSRLASVASVQSAALTAKRTNYPKMRLDRVIPLQGLVNGRNLRVADLNGDGKPELILAQSSSQVAALNGMTRLTCISVLDLDGKLLWQAGVPDVTAPITNNGLNRGDLPFQVHDLFGDGKKVIVCVFGYDLQIRDGKTGKVLVSSSAPETAPVGADFKEISSSFGAAWGDETLNMNIAHIAFCDTQGNGGRREIIVKDDFHHLAVLDPFSSPPLQQLFRNRGNHGHFPWVGDIDGDGKDEIMAGYSLLGDNGKCLRSLFLSGHQNAIAVLDPLNAGGKQKRIFLCAGQEGFVVLPESFHSGSGATGRNEGCASRLAIAKFRAQLQGLQIATLTSGGYPGILRLFDASMKLLWSKELRLSSGPLIPVNWSGRPEEVLLYSMAPSAGLLDGQGDGVVETPDSGPCEFYDTTDQLGLDGRDSVLAWDQTSLAVYVPENAPLNGKIYRPSRSGIENSSSYRARVSLPVGW